MKQRAKASSVLGVGVLVVMFAITFVGASVARAANTFVPAAEITGGELSTPARIAVDEASGDVQLDGQNGKSADQTPVVGNSCAKKKANR